MKGMLLKASSVKVTLRRHPKDTVLVSMFLFKLIAQQQPEIFISISH